MFDNCKVPSSVASSEFNNLMGMKNRFEKSGKSFDSACLDHGHWFGLCGSCALIFVNLDHGHWFWTVWIMGIGFGLFGSCALNFVNLDHGHWFWTVWVLGTGFGMFGSWALVLDCLDVLALANSSYASNGVSSTRQIV